MGSPTIQPYEDVDVAPLEVDRNEPLGTKPKQWLRDSEDRRWLYKWLTEEQARRGRGEDWAEKAVGEIAVALGVPSARVELAHRNATRGILSFDVADGRELDLVHGNELLAGQVANYRRAELRKIIQYRVDTVIAVRQQCQPSPWSHRPPVEDFAGYLLLDALVANTDRHHENWAVLVARRGTRAPVLAPSFDHASSLACGLTDAARRARLSTKDVGFAVPAYARRAPSHFADAPTLVDAVVRLGELSQGR